MTFTLGHANIENPDPLSHQLHTISEVASRADVVTWNETDDTRNALRAMAGWDEVLAGGIGITWRVKKFDLIGSGSKRVMKGGRHNGRRLGPSRYEIHALLEESARVIIAAHHSVAKGDTDNKWRRPFRAAGWRGVVTELRAVQKRHPGVPLILAGDFNAIWKITAFVALGVREVKTPATFGKKRYDRIFATPGIVSNVRAITTKSDHRALLATVTLGGTITPAPTPAPKPPAPKPKPPKEETMNKLPADLPKRLRAAGLKVVELDGWKTRGRPRSKGPFNPAGVLWHHTGANNGGLSYSKWMALTGRPGDGLPAPLCQLAIRRDGTVDVLASGRANHAGKARASGSMAGGDGNAMYVGVECHNNGSEGWSKAQYDAMVKTGAVLARLLGTSVRAQRAHRETSVTGKWDPGKLDMDEFREDIAAALGHSTPNPEPAKPEPVKNHVTEGRRLIRAGLAELRKARDKRGKPRKVVNERADLIEAICKKGPSS